MMKTNILIGSMSRPWIEIRTCKRLDLLVHLSVPWSFKAQKI